MSSGRAGTVEGQQDHAPTAVVVDRLALMRLGIGRALMAAGVYVIGEADRVEDGLQLVRQLEPSLMVVGDAPLSDATDIMRSIRPGPLSSRVMMLVSSADRPGLLAAMGAGVGGVTLRSTAADDLAELAGGVLRGERSVAPALVSLLVSPGGDHGDTGRPPSIPLDGLLTAKELQVLHRLAEGASNQEIAEALYVTPATVKTHLAHIYTKLGVRGRHEALSRALALGILT
jgi:DNA-binding NarL/FixJ family response regulator